MEKVLPIEERSISQIYIESQETITYMIPVYQRNYAWEKDEITTLIKDVYDSYSKEKDVYYIGTLVTYKRENNVYEVIDGQQRLTTLYIILKVLGIKDICNKLTYGARKVSASTIQKLDDYPNLGDDVDNGIRNGYEYAENAIDTIIDTKDIEKFKGYFLEKVYLIHYNVPKDVDLNHYFEVMNSRGEQLEKHEIVKSWLSQCLNETEISTFSRVWEACSEMNIYIQQAFPETKVFGRNLCQFKLENSNFLKDICEQEESEGKKTIINLLKQPISKKEEITSTEQTDKFQPIIDFPNYLLIVVKVTMAQYHDYEPTDFVLDDKELLNEFKNVLDDVVDRVEFVKDFTYNLLRAKFFLDNYIVHHSLDNKELSGDNPWKLQYYYLENSKKKYPKNLGVPNIQDELVHLLSMFEVTFTPKQHKNYLFYCMMHLFETPEPKDCKYLEFLQRLADKYFYDVYLNRACLNERNQPVPNAFDNALFIDGELNVDEIGVGGIDYRAKFEEIYQQGKSNVPLFVFNYTDYKLWKKYADELRGNKTKIGSKERVCFFEKLGCNDFGLDFFDNFYFTRTRKSLEHFYPQANAGEGKPLSTDDINCFGNFAMIGAETNSSGSNLNPTNKLYRYSDGKTDQVSVASLKFKIMMQKCLDNRKLDREIGMEWKAEDIKEHQQKMLDIIIKNN